MNGDNRETDRLLGRLIAQVDHLSDELRELKSYVCSEFASIKEAQDRNLTNHHSRIAILELKSAEQKGGMKMLALLCSAAATVGGIISTALSHLFAK